MKSLLLAAMIAGAATAATASLTSCQHDDWTSEHILTDLSPDSIGLNPRSHYLVVLGDIQSYTLEPEMMPWLKASMEWVELQNSFFHNIDAVIQVGDLTNDNYDWEWSRAQLVMRPVAEAIPTIAVTGNHDYDWLREPGDRFSLITSRLSTRFNRYLLPMAPGMRLEGTFEPGRRENAVYSLTIGGREARVVALEFAPRPEAVEWARSFVDAEPAIDFYLVTHEWLRRDGNIVAPESSYARRHFGPDSLALPPDSVWSRLVYPCDNIVALICGHNGFVARRVTPNAAGRPVAQMLFNLQYEERGGNSMLQLWEFPEGSDSVYTYVYHTMGRYHHPDYDTRFNFSRARNKQ